MVGVHFYLTFWSANQILKNPSRKGSKHRTLPAWPLQANPCPMRRSASPARCQQIARHNRAAKLNRIQSASVMATDRRGRSREHKGIDGLLNDASHFRRDGIERNGCFIRGHTAFVTESAYRRPASIRTRAETTLFPSSSASQNCNILALPCSWMKSFRKALVSTKCRI
jgi:hypothetical protein